MGLPGVPQKRSVQKSRRRLLYLPVRRRNGVFGKRRNRLRVQSSEKEKNKLSGNTQEKSRLKNKKEKD